MIGSEAKPFAFISSFTEEHQALRASLFEMGQILGRYVWVCEHEACRPDLYARDALEICDTLMDRVRESQIYIAILGADRRGEREHGTAVRIDERATSTSHFEIELFQAALLGKPIELFIVKGFSPGPRLQALMEILGFALPRSDWRIPMDTAEIQREFALLLRSKRLLSSNPWSRDRKRLRGNLVTQLYRKRGRDDRNALRFLANTFEKRARLPDKELIEDLLAKASSSPDQEHRLSRIWLAVRELMAVPPDEGRFSEYLPLWNRALGYWGSAAAWYGLHAHLYLGGLAALQSMAEVRIRMRSQRFPGISEEESKPPATALASALYSIAKLMPSARERRTLLVQALHNLETSDDKSPRARSNVFALRGSILLRQMRVSEAVSAFEDALRLRSANGEEDGRIGESMSELGFAYLCQGRLLKGRTLMKFGVNYLSSQNNGFLIRARKKLAVGYTLTGRPLLARGELKEAKRLAHELRIFDQV